MRRLLLALAALPTLATTAACGTFAGTAQPAFEQSMLNATWYGTYHRPFEAASTPSGSAQVAQAPSSSPAPRTEPARTARPEPARNEPARSEPARVPAPAVAATASERSAPPAPTDASGVYQPDHAAAYVRAVYALNETSAGPDDGTIVDLYRYAQENGSIYHSPRPAGGDLVFFHNTWDRNGDGRNNDWFTHVGVVEQVASDGTISVLSYLGGRVGRVWMNLERPDVLEHEGRPVNTELRRPDPNDSELTQYAAGVLFAGFASLLDDRDQVLVLDTWQPGRGAVASR